MTQLTWDTATEWDSAASESGVYHENVSNTDHSDAALLGKGMPYNSLYKSANLLCYYPMQEDSGSTMVDLGTNGDGSYVGTTLNQGTFLGTGVTGFDGVDDYADVPKPWASTQVSALTISFWAWFDSLDSSADDTFFASPSDVNPISYEHDSTNEWRCNLKASGGTTIRLTTTNQMNTGQWLHFLVTHDSASGQELYINDVLEASDTVADTLNSNNGNWTLAADSSQSENTDAKFCEFAAWDTSFTSTEATEIHDIYAAQGSLITAGKTS